MVAPGRWSMPSCCYVVPIDGIDTNLSFGVKMGHSLSRWREVTLEYGLVEQTSVVTTANRHHDILMQFNYP